MCIIYILFFPSGDAEKKKCLLRGYILVRNMASIPPKKKDRVCMQICGVWALNCHYSTFPKSDSMEILKSARSLCQCDGRLCRFSGSKLIRGGLQCRSEEFSVYSFDSKRIQLCSTLEVHH